MPSYLDSAISSLNDAIGSVGESIETWSSSWQKSMDDMRKQSKEFIRVFDELEEKKAIVERDPVAKKEFESLMSKGRLIYKTISSIVDDEKLSENLKGMGILPLIPIAAVLAALTAITAWLSSAYVMLAKIKLAEKALAAGKDPLPILEAKEKGILENISATTHNFFKISVVVAGGFFLWKFWPEIKQRIS